MKPAAYLYFCLTTKHMKQILLLLSFLALGVFWLSSSHAQTVKVKYKKFVVPGQTEYGRWVSSAARRENGKYYG